MASLKDVAFALDPPGTSGWSVRASVNVGIWPPLTGLPSISIRALVKRFGNTGIALRKLSTGEGDKWKRINRKTLVSQLRDRIRDPAIIRQNPTGLCGPLAIVVELARRHPIRYVNAVHQLFDTGKLTPALGEAIEAAEDLREKPVPAGPIDSVDWILAATMRENENVTEDVDDAEGIEAITLWGAMSDWTHDILDLNAHWETCIHSGELDALLTAQKAIDAGGVAFLLIDSNLIKDGEDDNEENMRWSRKQHTARTPVGRFGSLVHSEDDAFPPDHWVVYMGKLSPSHPSEDDKIKLRLWSWGREYALRGTADSFGEYLYAVVTGTP